jgi:hypothetical protein
MSTSATASMNALSNAASVSAISQCTPRWGATLGQEFTAQQLTRADGRFGKPMRDEYTFHIVLASVRFITKVWLGGQRVLTTGAARRR